MARRTRQAEISRVAGAAGGLGRVVRVLPGNFHVTDDPDLTIITVLGSCVSACVRNPWTGFGGLNHFLLPEGDADDGIGIGTACRFGNFAMEALINAVLKSGCQRSDLEVKLFGGADMIGSTSNVGRQNSNFALKYLEAEGITVSNHDIGGINGRRIEYNPNSGTVNRLILRAFERNKLFEDENRYKSSLLNLNTIGDICLFK